MRENKKNRGKAVQMSDIVVYTNPTTLESKKDLQFRECSWKFRRFPKDVLPNNKIYFAGKIVIN